MDRAAEGPAPPDQTSPKHYWYKHVVHEIVSSQQDSLVPMTWLHQASSQHWSCFCYTMKMGLSREKIKKRSSDLDYCHCQQGIIFRGPRKKGSAEHNEGKSWFMLPNFHLDLTPIMKKALWETLASKSFRVEAREGLPEPSGPEGQVCLETPERPQRRAASEHVSAVCISQSKWVPSDVVCGSELLWGWMVKSLRHSNRGASQKAVHGALLRGFTAALRTQMAVNRVH